MVAVKVDLHQGPHAINWGTHEEPVAAGSVIPGTYMWFAKTEEEKICRNEATSQRGAAVPLEKGKNDEVIPTS